jgi:Ca2+-binding RTX toxin-like protein
VTLVDTTPPEVFAPSDIVAEAVGLSNTMVELGEATAHDKIGIASVTEHPPRFFVLGETTVTWTATDTSGNSASATQIVTIVDNTAPELTVPEDVMISAFSLEKQVEIGEAQAHDSVDSTLTITNDAPDTFPLGDTVVTWNVSDEFGNSSSSQQVISVQPCGKPLSYYNQIFGTPAADTIVGTEVADLIFAFAGDDIISGGSGNDCIIGGDGDDFIFGNAGNDHLVGGEGNDILKGYSGDDKLTGGIGYDILDGGDDFDVSYDSASDIIINCEEQL